MASMTRESMEIVLRIIADKIVLVVDLKTFDKIDLIKTGPIKIEQFFSETYWGKVGLTATSLHKVSDGCDL